MESIKYILGQHEVVDGIVLHPVKVKDYDEFMSAARVLMFSKAYLGVQDDIPLLLVLILGIKDNREILDSLEKLFSLVTKEDVYFFIRGTAFGFRVGDEHVITTENYDAVRTTIMRQNLLFEPKRFANPIVQEWADRVIEARRKNAVSVTLEDMMTTVSVYSGKTYDVLAEQTLYQLHADFERIGRLKEHDKSVQFRCVTGDTPIPHFAEELNMFKDPYADIFVDSKKVSGLNNALKSH